MRHSCLSQWHTTKRLVYPWKKISNIPPQRVIDRKALLLWCATIYSCGKINLFTASPFLPTCMETLSSQSAPKILTSDWLTRDGTIQPAFSNITLLAADSPLIIFTYPWRTPNFIEGSLFKMKPWDFWDHLFLFLFRKMAKRHRSLLEEGNSHHVTSDARGREFVILLPAAHRKCGGSWVLRHCIKIMTSFWNSLVTIFGWK